MQEDHRTPSHLYKSYLCTEELCHAHYVLHHGLGHTQIITTVDSQWKLIHTQVNRQKIIINLEHHRFVLATLLKPETPITSDARPPLDDTICNAQEPIPDEDEPDSRCSFPDAAHSHTPTQRVCDVTWPIHFVRCQPNSLRGNQTSDVDPNRT